MKITSVDVFEIKPMNTGAPVVMRVNTDAGISGFGEVGLAYGKAHHAAVGIARDFGQLLVGRDPRPGVVIPLYKAPEGISPAAARYLSKMGLADKAFAATVMDMAVRGALAIKELST